MLFYAQAEVERLEALEKPACDTAAELTAECAAYVLGILGLPAAWCLSADVLRENLLVLKMRWPFPGNQRSPDPAEVLHGSDFRIQRIAWSNEGGIASVTIEGRYLAAPK